MNFKLNLKIFDLLKGTDRDACVNENGVFLETTSGFYKLEVSPITREQYNAQWKIACDIMDQQEVNGETK